MNQSALIEEPNSLEGEVELCSLLGLFCRYHIQVSPGAGKNLLVASAE